MTLPCGFFDWRGQHEVEGSPAAPIAYDRFDWRDLEPVSGVYDFGLIVRSLEAADARGQRFAFRVRSYHNDPPDKRYAPDYVYTDANTLVPSWNSAEFLMGALRLLSAIGAIYDGDPRIAWIEIGLIGRWGEWAIGNLQISDETMKLVVKFHQWTIKKTQLVMMAKTRACAVVEALSDPRIGWRVDGLGLVGYYDFDTNPNYALAWPLMKDRWKTAPVIAEVGGNGFDPDSVLDAVYRFHLWLVGNGNFNWGKLTGQQKSALWACGYMLANHVGWGEV